MKHSVRREMPRIWRSPFSDFGKTMDDKSGLRNETVTASGVYKDKVLAGIAGSGFNGIWVHGLLRNIVPSDVFPEFGRHTERHVGNMNALIRRAAAHGLKVFVYMQPPRAIDVKDPFWKSHLDAGGVINTGLSGKGREVRARTLCTSTQNVKDFLRLSSADVVRQLPGLGGIILITASEYPSHCYARSLPPEEAGSFCERCGERQPSDVVSEIVGLIRDGVRSVSSKPRIIAWNWSWTHYKRYEKDPESAIIRKLPKDVMMMADFERGDTKIILGKRRPIDEYSLSFVGPSKRFTRSYRIAKRQKLEVMAKLQIGTTHELATVPNLPLVGNLLDKVRQLRKLGIEAFMACWNFGNMLTANTTAFNSFAHMDTLVPRKKTLAAFAADYFPGCDSRLVVQAWEEFGNAMDSYPFSIPFIYYGPVNYSPAYPLKPGPLKGMPIGRSWHVDKRGDELERSLRGYTLAEVIRGLNLVAQGWEKGLVLLDKGLKSSSCAEAKQELDNARVCYHVFRSAWNTYRVYRLRRAWSDKTFAGYVRIIRNELENLRGLLPIVASDSRFGFHSEPNAYMFTAELIRKKMRGLKRQLAAHRAQGSKK